MAEKEGRQAGADFDGTRSTAEASVEAKSARGKGSEQSAARRGVGRKCWRTRRSACVLPVAALPSSRAWRAGRKEPEEVCGLREAASLSDDFGRDLVGEGG